MTSRIPLTGISLHRLADPKRGDIVVFDSKAADMRLVKRVIGLPGDTVEMRNNVLIINGVAATYSKPRHVVGATYLTENYLGIAHRIELMAWNAGRFSSFGPVTVPKDRYLVLGDNRDDSADSRVYGFIARDEIVGNASRVVLSLDYDRHYAPRMDRFFHPL